MAGHKENVQGGKREVIEYCMASDKFQDLYVILKHLKGNCSVYSRDVEPLEKQSGL